MEVAEYARIAAAEDDHWWYRNTRALMMGLLEPWLASGHRFLDAGCGPGGNGAWLSAHGHVIGLDLASDALEFVKVRHPEMSPVQGSLDALPLADDSMDAVACITVLTSVPDDVAAVRELARVVKPGGGVLLIEPAFNALRRGHDVTVHSRRRYRLRDLTGLARGGGLVVNHASYAYSFLAPAAALLSAAWRLRPRPAESAGSDVERNALGGVFGRLARAERSLVLRRRVPFGTSAVVLAVKPSR